MDIDREHPEYKTRKGVLWRKYRDLYAGGEQFIGNAGPVPGSGARRSRREVYSERLSRAVLRKLHRLDRGLVRGDAIPPGTGAHVRGKQDGGAGVLRCFVEDWTGRATHLGDFFRQQFIRGAGRGNAVTCWWTFRVAGTGANAGGGRCDRSLAGVSGGLCTRRDHQLEPGRTGRLRVGGDPHEAIRKAAGGGSPIGGGDALVVLRQGSAFGSTGVEHGENQRAGDGGRGHRTGWPSWGRFRCSS